MQQDIYNSPDIEFSAPVVRMVMDRAERDGCALDTVEHWEHGHHKRCVHGQMLAQIAPVGGEWDEWPAPQMPL